MSVLNEWETSNPRLKLFVLEDMFFMLAFGIFLLVLLYSIQLITDDSKKRNLNIIAKAVAFGTSVLVFFRSLCLVYYFDKTQPFISQQTQQLQPQFKGLYDWWPNMNFDFFIGVDGISLWLIVLTTFTIPLCILISVRSILKNIISYLFFLLVTELLLVLIFSVYDIFLFYILFESTLIPMFFLVGIWGSRSRKIKAAYYLLFFTLFGSLLMLLAIGYIYVTYKTTRLDLLLSYNFKIDPYMQTYLWPAFFLGLAIKLPIYPFHLWLPEAHVEAPTGGSVILAGLLLKLGGFGFFRLLLLLFPEACLDYYALVFVIAIISLIYASLSTIVQTDLKRIIAYSSIAHMNFLLLGIFSFNVEAFEGAILLMLGHGLVSGALFILIGILYDKYHTKLISYYGGITAVMPIFSVFFVYFVLGNIALPGTCNFVGEFLISVGIFKFSTLAAFFGCTSMILSAVYTIYLNNRLNFGTLKTTYIKSYSDIFDKQSLLALVLLVIVSLIMGVFPTVFLDYMHTDIQALCEFISIRSI